MIISKYKAEKLTHQINITTGDILRGALIGILIVITIKILRAKPIEDHA